MPTEISPIVRTGEEPDVQDLAELLRATVAGMLESGIQQWDDIYPTPEILAADVRARQLFVAHLEGKIAGCIVINTYQDPEYADVPWTLLEAPIAVVHRLMIHPRAQGRGVARALMQVGEVHAREQGFATMRLDAFADNPRALKLYPGLGYRHAGFVQLRKGRFYVYEKSLS